MSLPARWSTILCSECQTADKKSKTFRDSQTMATVAPSFYYWDEDGKLHDHDCEVTTLFLRCTNGHKWTVQDKIYCWCGWTP